MKNPKGLVAVVQNVETSFHKFMQDSTFSGPYQMGNSLRKKQKHDNCQNRLQLLENPQCIPQ